jgi:rod shape-determining protein MreD
MKTALFILLIIFSVLVQTTIFSYFHLRFFQPDIPLICTIYYGLLAGFFHGYLFGFFVGILVDAFSGGIFGISAFLLTIIGSISGNLNRWVIINDIKTQLTSLFLGTIFHGVFFLLLNKAFDVNVKFISSFINLILPQSAIHLLLGLIIYSIMKKTIKNEDQDNRIK